MPFGAHRFAYPDGGRALFNDAILANAANDFAAVFDAGIYGSAAYDPVTKTKLPKSDPTFNDKRSKFPASPRSATVAVAYAAGSSIVLNSALRVGDTIATSDDRTKICGPIRSIAANGDGTFTHTFQTGGNASGSSVAVGGTVSVVATADGTHEEVWMHLIEAQAYVDMKLAGIFGQIPAAA